MTQNMLTVLQSTLHYLRLSHQLVFLGTPAFQGFQAHVPKVKVSLGLVPQGSSAIYGQGLRVFRPNPRGLRGLQALASTQGQQCFRVLGLGWGPGPPLDPPRVRAQASSALQGQGVRVLQRFTVRALGSRVLQLFRGQGSSAPQGQGLGLGGLSPPSSENQGVDTEMTLTCHRDVTFSQTFIGGHLE